ncbi:hypothetical protein H072_10697 [Dactylellina haptotyla CBS 200.50]|uniref:PD-(D/E)XK nuclease-like domain-containing protein n=2 Tax=Dactylellina haptotyla (strain CBS 200.50) TaxID=1284197 RepID=S7ZYL2_DACHA|nr:hypothetical protein H072_10697 [Dactylellina haptotyla CBS 200.50]
MEGAGEMPSPTTDFLTRSFKRRISEWQADVQSHVPPAQIHPPVPKKRKSSKSENLRATAVASTAKEYRADRDNRTPEERASSKHVIRRKSSSRDLRPSTHHHHLHHHHGIREGTASRISLGRLNLESKSQAQLTEKTVTQRPSSPVLHSPDTIMRIKRESLDRTRPSFRFLGCSGGAGKFSRATRTIGVGVGGFLKRLSGWCSAQGCIPVQFKDDIDRLDPFTYLPDLVFGGFADEWSDRDLDAELDFVTRSIQNSEKLHVSSSTETEWVMHTKAIFEHAFKTYESTVSVLVATTVDLEPALLPIDMGRLSAPPRLQTSTSKPRKNSISSLTESDTGQYDTASAKVDISIGLDKTDPIVADFLKDLEATCRTRAPTAFTHSIPFPIIPVKVKDESGSSLAAEYETTLCASAMLASWSSASATTAPATLHPANLNSSMMQTDDLAPTDVLDEDITTEIKPSPLVLTVSVIGANWYYNVVYTDDIKDFTGTRHVLGPFLIGQSRNFLGTFQILRFLRMACEWGVKEWVKDMCEKLGDNEGLSRGLAKLTE